MGHSRPYWIVNYSCENGGKQKLPTNDRFMKEKRMTRKQKGEENWQRDGKRKVWIEKNAFLLKSGNTTLRNSYKSCCFSLQQQSVVHCVIQYVKRYQTKYTCPRNMLFMFNMPWFKRRIKIYNFFTTLSCCPFCDHSVSCVCIKIAFAGKIITYVSYWKYISKR